MSPAQPTGYLAAPSEKSQGYVLVLHAWWGLNDTIRNLCDQLATAGFVAFAPDLYHGKVATTIPEAEQFATELDQRADRAKAEIVEALRFLQASGDAGAGVAVIGFSLGAYYALDLSASEPQAVRSVVLFYGTGPADFSRATADYLGHFAETDEYEPLENVEELEQELKSAGRAVTFYRYSDAGHWFFEPDRPQAYHPAAAALAWERTLAFLQRSAGA